MILGGLLTSLVGLDRARLAGAEEETKVSHSKRGGILVAAEGHRFEVFFYPTGVRVFPLDTAGNAVDTSRLTASVTVSYPDAPREPSLLTSAPSRADRYRYRAIVLGREHRPRGCSREDHDRRLRDHRSFRYDRVHRDVQGSAGIRRQGSRHQHDTNISSEPRKIARLGYEGNRPDVVSEPRTLPQPADRPDVVSEPRTLPQPAEATPAYVGTRMDSGSNTSKNATTAGLMRRDWTTGRDNLPLAKPWLPMR